MMADIRKWARRASKGRLNGYSKRNPKTAAETTKKLVEVDFVDKAASSRTCCEIAKTGCGFSLQFVTAAVTFRILLSGKKVFKL